jgi:hypothetical protein
MSACILFFLNNARAVTIVQPIKNMNSFWCMDVLGNEPMFL